MGRAVACMHLGVGVWVAVGQETSENIPLTMQIHRHGAAKYHDDWLATFSFFSHNMSQSQVVAI